MTAAYPGAMHERDDFDPPIGHVAPGAPIGMTSKEQRRQMRRMASALRKARLDPTARNAMNVHNAGDRARQKLAGNRRFTPPKGRR